MYYVVSINVTVPWSNCLSVMFLHCAQTAEDIGTFLADRTNGRAYATVLRLSVVRPSTSVCDVMYCG